jgi:hypothetical protein
MKNRDLSIPAFLRRRKPQRRTRDKPLRRYVLPDLALPTGKLWAKAKLQRLHINNELPRIGCGVRQLLVRSGRKWVHLAEPGGGMQRIKRTVYDTIKRLANV